MKQRTLPKLKWVCPQCGYSTPGPNTFKEFFNMMEHLEPPMCTNPKCENFNLSISDKVRLIEIQKRTENVLKCLRLLSRTDLSALESLLLAKHQENEKKS